MSPSVLNEDGVVEGMLNGSFQLRQLEGERDAKRKRMEDLCQQKFAIDRQMKELLKDLERLDNEIDAMDGTFSALDSRSDDSTIRSAAPFAAIRTVKPEPSLSPTPPSAALTPNNNDIGSEPATTLMTTQADEFLTDPMTMMTLTPLSAKKVRESQGRACDGEDSAFGGVRHSLTTMRSSELASLEFTTTAAAVTMQKRPPPRPDINNNSSKLKPKTGTLEDYYVVSEALKSTDNINRTTDGLSLQPVRNHEPPAVAQKLTNLAATGIPNYSSSNNKYPWSPRVLDLLHHTFRIPTFRDQQQDIIDATLSGRDVFVIMRTGGGKSLTYQLPALLEGRFPLPPQQRHKVTLVISPLLSLIQDQEEQMNAFAPGSAVSFTSSLGASEHARRWGLVRDANAGVCLVFCTPEKVSKSNKLCAELDKLFAQGRLGRFVIDEAHCACQWGHDFRPDYAQLGKLKSHFPSIPVIAVTATASDRVRKDVCEILRVGSNYNFFRSTANRPNLVYSVKAKPDRKDAIIAEMAEFIKEKYAHGAGIVYTYSRKDADTVANSLCDYGVIAEAYHSDVSVTKKEAIHRSWMRNDTQVVVATIAFGLGINKPDVRFVLHHSISKTLEAYYQESGRAGRDGEPAECILYYSPKDFVRMLKMVHGTSSEHLLLPMIRYAQQSGNDAICKAIMLTHLGEPNVPEVMQVVKENEGIATTQRDVGMHAQTLVKLLSLRLREGRDMTMAMLVKDWRATGAAAASCVKDNPPGKDGLTVEECERIIISLLLENVLATNPIWNAYDTVIYFVLGPLGARVLQSDSPRFVIQLPKRESTKAAAVMPTKACKQSKARKAVAKDGEWLSAKPKAAKRKKAASTKSNPAKKAKSKSTKIKAAKTTRVTKKSAKARQPKRVSSEVIELLSEDEDLTVVDFRSEPVKQNSKCDADGALWDDDSSDEEFEFFDD